jgi:hypothetical protein
LAQIGPEVKSPELQKTKAKTNSKTVNAESEMMSGTNDSNTNKKAILFLWNLWLSGKNSIKKD